MQKDKMFAQSLGQSLETRKSRLGGARVYMFHGSSLEKKTSDISGHQL